MKDIFQQVLHWEKQGKEFAIATVVDTWRSAPRSVGSSMIIDSKMNIVGSVSGGCVEGAVIKVAQEVIKDQVAVRKKYGVSNEDAWSAGLSCGGAIEVFTYPFFNVSSDLVQMEIWKELSMSLTNNRPCLLATRISNDAPHLLLSHEGELTGSTDGFPPKTRLNKILASGKSSIVRYRDRAFFIHVFPANDHLLIIGASHISVPLVQLAGIHGFDITIVDPRGVFADSLGAICAPDKLLTSWPAEVLPNLKLDSNVYAVTLTHDPKIDDQALKILLDSEVSYIGALGSTRTHTKRMKRLQEAGIDAREIERIYAPVGLNISAGSPDEIALSIMAQIIQVKNARLSSD
ncbi:MAG: XdhC family protein [Saprospiraceae bacterium]|nr:XdhC family protein [Saprospiraceae bacterium]